MTCFEIEGELQNNCIFAPTVNSWYLITISYNPPEVNAILKSSFQTHPTPLLFIFKTPFTHKELPSSATK